MNPVDTLETAKAANPLIQLQTFGQSIWLDYIRRDLMKGGELQRLIKEDGLRGMTSNPAIFEKAIAGSTQYPGFSRFARRPRRPRRQRPLRTAGHPRHSGRCRPARARLPEHEKARRLREPRSLSVSRARHQWHHRRGAAAVEERGPRKRDDQSAGHRRKAFPHFGNCSAKASTST